jgi:hypothetical protein
VIVWTCLDDLAGQGGMGAVESRRRSTLTTLVVYSRQRCSDTGFARPSATEPSLPTTWLVLRSGQVAGAETWSLQPPRIAHTGGSSRSSEPQCPALWPSAALASGSA